MDLARAVLMELKPRRLPGTWKKSLRVDFQKKRVDEDKYDERGGSTFRPPFVEVWSFGPPEQRRMTGDLVVVVGLEV